MTTRTALLTRRRRVLLAALVGLATIGAVACAPPATGHVVDVNNPPQPVIGGFVTSDQWMHVQTFTARYTGLLDQVDLWIQFIGPGDVLVDIHQVDAPLVLGPSIGSAVHNGPATGEVAVPLAQPAPVLAGQRYAVTVRGTVSTTGVPWQLSFSADVPIAGEAFFVRYPNHPDVYPSPTASMSLRTYIRPGWPY